MIIEIDFDGKIVMQIALNDLQGKGVSALAKVGGSYFIACFNSGEVHEWAGDNLSRLAGGLSAPASLYTLAEDRLLVANFSGDSVSEISI